MCNQRPITLQELLKKKDGCARKEREQGKERSWEGKEKQTGERKELEMEKRCERREAKRKSVEGKGAGKKERSKEREMGKERSWEGEPSLIPESTRNANILTAAPLGAGSSRQGRKAAADRCVKHTHTLTRTHTCCPRARPSLPPPPSPS